VLSFNSFVLRSTSVVGNESTGVFQVGNPLTAGGGLLINFAEDAVARIVGSTIAHNTAFRRWGAFCTWQRGAAGGLWLQDYEQSFGAGRRRHVGGGGDRGFVDEKQSVRQPL
jgi:hypothetical protein